MCSPLTKTASPVTKQQKIQGLKKIKITCDVLILTLGLSVTICIHYKFIFHINIAWNDCMQLSYGL